MWSDLNKFYKSKEWLCCRDDILISRPPICWHCGQGFKADEVIICHHKTELTLGNVNDYNISLNPDNVELIHHECHNAIHKRYGYGHYKKKLKERGVYIVYGPPMSGKTTYVLDNKKDNDLIIDMDSLFEAITMLPRYNKPKALLQNVFTIRNSLIDNIKTRYGKFNNAWIIGGYADKYERDMLQRELGAELILIKPSKEELYERLYECNDYRKNDSDNWKQYIDDWFEKFVE